jgi:tripartite-type tricarboxylate transporter receptor subunit TctC
MTADNEGHSSRTARRTFLKAAGGVGSIGLVAGCLGGDGGDGSGDGGGDGGATTGTPTSSPTPSFPTEEVTWIVPYGPGGGYDFYTRALAQTINENDLMPVDNTVTNVEGAGGVTATNQVWNADADGHTLMIVNTESFAINQIARDAAQYDLREMTALPRVAGTLRAVAVSTQTDITTFSELNEATKAGDVNWGNQGPNTTSAVQVKALAALGGNEVFSLDDYESNSVTFNGRGEEYTALKRGDTHVMTGSYSSLFQFVEAGDARYVLVYNNEDQCPPDQTTNADCVTFETTSVNIANAEQIIAISGGPFHRIFAGPPGIPDGVHDYLCEVVTEAIQHDQFAALAEEAGRPIKYGDCELANQGLDSTVETYLEQRDLLEEMGVL